MFLIIVLVLISFTFSVAQLNTIRKTQHGSVRGQILTSRANSTIQYLSFQGIQYATPPLGKLRFKEPRPPKPWANTKCALKHKQICMQYDPANSTRVIGSEDCLYLDVSIPITAKNVQKMPVMVWIHGGNWITETTNITGPDYFMEKPVVLVQIEYRLNIFGFFSMLDDNAEGNYGLKDQLLALKWVQTNIEHFNGDPSRVTIFGSCSGGTSVFYHMFSPRSKGLFSGAITQTGTLLCDIDLQRHPMETTRRLLMALNLDGNDNGEIVEQLQAIEAETLFRLATNFSVMGYYTIFDTQPFGPVIERESNTSFITKSSLDVLRSGNYTKVPLLMGFNSQEGEFCWNYVQNGRVDINMYQRNPRLLIPHSMNIPQGSSCIDQTLNNITKEYFPDRNYTNAYEWIPYMSLERFVVGTLEAAHYLEEKVPVYFYYLSYVGSRNIAYLRPSGVGHQQEISYLFYPQGYNANPNETVADKLTRKRMVTLWTNFAAERNPTPKREELLQNVIWPPIKSKQNYLNINSTLKIGSPIPDQSRVSFWKKQYDACGFPDSNPNNG